MALKKAIQSRSGVTMEYWKISSWNINMSQRIMDISLVPYVSVDTREDGLEPIHEETRKIRVYDRVDKFVPANNVTHYTDFFSPEALEVYEGSIYTLMYEYIKEHVGDFIDAEDV